MHRSAVEPETPVWSTAFRLEARPVGVAQVQGGTVIDRRLAQEPRPGALAVELLLGFVTRIEPAGDDQPVTSGGIKLGAIGLPDQLVGDNTQPGEILFDAIGKLTGGARLIGVVHPEDVP